MDSLALCEQVTVFHCINLVFWHLSCSASLRMLLTLSTHTQTLACSHIHFLLLHLLSLSGRDHIVCLVFLLPRADWFHAGPYFVLVSWVWYPNKVLALCNLHRLPCCLPNVYWHPVALRLAPRLAPTVWLPLIRLTPLGSCSRCSLAYLGWSRAKLQSIITTDCPASRHDLCSVPSRLAFALLLSSSPRT